MELPMDLNCFGEDVEPLIHVFLWPVYICLQLLSLGLEILYYLVNLVLFVVWLIFGAFLFQSKAMVVRPVWNFYFGILTNGNTHCQRKLIDRKYFNTSMLSHVLLMSVPQFALQYVNNEEMEITRALLPVICISVTTANVVFGVAYFFYWMVINGKHLQDVPLAMGTQHLELLLHAEKLADFKRDDVPGAQASVERIARTQRVLKNGANSPSRPTRSVADELKDQFTRTENEIKYWYGDEDEEDDQFANEASRSSRNFYPSFWEKGTSMSGTKGSRDADVVQPISPYPSSSKSSPGRSPALQDSVKSSVGSGRRGRDRTRQISHNPMVSPTLDGSSQEEKSIEAPLPHWNTSPSMERGEAGAMSSSADRRYRARRVRRDKHRNRARQRTDEDRESAL
jgi:hypothetical protein